MNSRRGGLMLAGVVLILAVANSAWAASEKVLYAFHGTDGCGPTSVIVGADGTLYGTTEAAGTSTCSGDGDSGAVFQRTTGNLYGGARGCSSGNTGGEVFELIRGDGEWTEQVLHTFIRVKDGKDPSGPLVFDAAGNLFGLTFDGGAGGEGTFFEVRP